MSAGLSRRLPAVARAISVGVRVHDDEVRLVASTHSGEEVGCQPNAGADAERRRRR